MKTLSFRFVLISVLGVAAPVDGSLLTKAREHAPVRGIVAVLDAGQVEASEIVELAKGTELTIYVQSSSRSRTGTIRAAVAKAGLLATRVTVDHGAGRIELADNVADLVISGGAAEKNPEVLRVLRPRGVALAGDDKRIKPVPAGTDDWSHPYHGPDNNPNSDDKLVRGDFKTQFIGYPKFSPMPQQTVSAGGVLFKAFGHIAHKANQNEVLNTLMAVNAYNGTILWRRPLPEGFMIHRNTMIATEDALYLGDDESCKVFDAKTGNVREQIMAPSGITDGPVWKWMALRDGVLYALIGNKEVRIETQESDRPGLGHWRWGVWKGYDYADPKSAFGFGRTLVAVDLKTKKVKWHFKAEDYLDARALVMNRDSIFGYSPDRSLTRIDVATGKVVWQTMDKELLRAIGYNRLAQFYTTGSATSCYLKCNDAYLFFAGPQRARLVAVDAAAGKVVWTHTPGNLQLVLRPDAVYAAGPQESVGGRLDYATGRVLEELPGRRACARATGCADSVFYRANGGTLRLIRGDGRTTVQHIDPIRPPCQDGVIVANGHLYFGPWMCGCQLSLYGNIALGPVGEPARPEPAGTWRVRPGSAHEVISRGPVKPLKVVPGDWPEYRGDSARRDVSRCQIGDSLTRAWETKVTAAVLPTAPVIAGGMVFVADRTGAVHGFDRAGRKRWTSYTAGPVYYPPAIAHDRAYVGSADGRVYAFEAKTGRLLWSYRVGPARRRVPVFDHLIATWPVAGGVVVRDGHVYAAAGIAHYDGTYVVKLDAMTGELKGGNVSSGVLGKESNNGISLQGNLRIEDGELRFLAGGVYETARYDLKTLECLNKPKEQITADFSTAFYPYYPSYGKYISLDYKCADGCHLFHDASYEGSKFTNLVLEEPPPAGYVRPSKEAARWLLPPLIRGKDRKPLLKARWRDQENRRFTSFVVAGDRLLAGGHPAARPAAAFLTLTDIASGKEVWKIDLPALPVKGGTAVTGDGRIYASLENGSLVCYQP